MTTEREAFEAWVAECHAGWNMKKSPRGHYLYTEAHTGWSAWQAACAWRKERDAGICDAIATDKWSLYKGRPPYTGTEPGRAADFTQGQSDGAEQCADKIRSAE